MKRIKTKHQKNPFEKLVDTKNKQKLKKLKKQEETNKLRDTYLDRNNKSIKMVNEKHLRIKKERNKYVKVGTDSINCIIFKT
jgi:beta-N-acetylglucosaminidase